MVHFVIRNIHGDGCPRQPCRCIIILVSTYKVRKSQLFGWGTREKFVSESCKRFLYFFFLSDIANQKTITSKTQVLWKFFLWITVSSFFFKQINIEEIMILGLKISKVDFWSQKSFYCHNFGYVILLKDNIQFR